MKTTQSILIILSLISILFTSCGSDDNQTEETNEEDTEIGSNLIVGTWDLTNVEIENSLLTGTIEDNTTGFPLSTDVEISFSTEIIGTNNYTSTFTENPNTLIDNGSFDLDFIITYTVSVLGFPTTESETESNTLIGTGTESSWSLNATNNEISFTPPSSTNNVTGQLLELTETSLKISTKVEDFLEDSEIEIDETLDDFTGNYGDLILTYSK